MFLSEANTSLPAHAFCACLIIREAGVSVVPVGAGNAEAIAAGAGAMIPVGVMMPVDDTVCR